MSDFIRPVHTNPARTLYEKIVYDRLNPAMSETRLMQQWPN